MEQEIINKIVELQEKHHELVSTLTAEQSYDFTFQIRKLRQELSDIYSDGANACAFCGEKPHGMLKTPIIMKDGLVDKPPVYEVGCIHCPPFPSTEKQNYMVSVSARGNSIEQAVKNWNEGNYISKPK